MLECKREGIASSIMKNALFESLVRLGLCKHSTSDRSVLKHHVCLGHVSLSSNVDNNFASRELKSVHVDAIGIFLKIGFQKNHVNRHNLFNQVLTSADQPLRTPNADLFRLGSLPLTSLGMDLWVRLQ